MSVKLSANPFFWAPALLVLAGDNGETFEHAFKCKFKRLKTSEHKLLARRLDAGRAAAMAAAGLAAIATSAPAVDEPQAPTPDQADPVKPITDTELLDQVLLDWQGLADEAGSPVSYSPAERLAANEEWFGLEAAMVRSYFDNAFPNARTAAKNSGAPRATS